MITIDDFFKQCIASDLWQTKCHTKGVLNEEEYSRANAMLNMALKTLFNRFDWKVKELLVQTSDWQSIYPLTSDHALTNTTSSKTKYIIDGVDNPFTDDILQVREVLDEDGVNIYLNDDNQFSSAYMVDYRTIQFTHPCSDNLFSLLYKAAYPSVPLEGMLTNSLDIAQVLEAPLRALFSSIYFNALSGQSASQTAQRLDNKYETLCQDIAFNNRLGLDVLSTNVKGYQRGYF